MQQNRRFSAHTSGRYPAQPLALFMMGLVVTLPVASDALARSTNLGEDSVFLESFYNPDFEPIGARLGDFLLHSEARAGYRFNDNIFADGREVHDRIFRLRPEIKAESDFSRHQLDLSTYLDIGRYAENDTENYEDFGATARGRLDVTGNTTIPLSVGFYRQHLDRENPDGNQNTEPLVFKLLRATAGIQNTGQQLAYKLISRFQSFEYENGVTTGGVLSTADRNVDLYNVYLSVGITPDAILAPYAYADFEEAKYEIDLGANNRDSTEYEFGLGAIVTFSDITKLSLNAGRRSRDFDGSNFNTISTLTYSGNLSWSPHEDYSLLLEADRNIDEAAFNGSSASITSQIRLRSNYQFRENIVFRPYGRFLDRDFQGLTTGNIQTYNAGLDVVYKMNRNMWVTANYDFTGQDADNSIAAAASFQRNNYTLSLTGKF